MRIASLIAFLALALRLPMRRIQAYLRLVHQLTISAGEVVELLHQVRRTLQAHVDDLKTQARASPILHADETCWRENGVNGYIWAFATPGEDAVRYYAYDHSRGQVVVKRILDGQFDGHLVSDFYCGYNLYAGKHQRCWVHLLRDLHALKEQQADDTDVVAWAQEVRALYDAAQRRPHEYPEPSQTAREQHYVALVVIHKISGGSRSAEGTKTRMALASLFETWQARGLNPFDECLKLLSQTTAS